MELKYNVYWLLLLLSPRTGMIATGVTIPTEPDEPLITLPTLPINTTTAAIPTTMPELTLISQAIATGLQTNSIAVDECNGTQSSCGSDSNANCIITVGGYLCVCKTGFSEVTARDGTVFCGKPLLVTQTFGLPYISDYGNVSSPVFLEFAKNISSKIVETYLEVEGVINVRRIINGSIIVWYETTLRNRPFSIIDLQRDHENAMKYGYGYNLGNITISPPTAANFAACFPTKIQSHALRSLKVSWTFGQARLGSWVLSNETCRNSNLTYVASIHCKTRNDSGIVTGYYDPNDLKETLCQKDPKAALNKIEQENVTSQDLPEAMATLAVVSSSLEDSSSTEIEDFVWVYEYLSAEVAMNGLEVSEFSMNSIIWAADNLHSTMMTGMPGVLDDMVRTSFINSLDIFADYLEFEGEDMEIEGTALEFQATHIDDSAEAITFVKTWDESEVGLPPSVFAHLPLSSLQDRQTLNSRSAVFLLHRDALLFPDVTEENTAISQVLSVKISNTNLENLADPINVTFPTPTNPVGISQLSGCSYTAKRCTFLNISTRRWEYTGCETSSAIMPGYTSCSCNHATNFAVLVQRHDVKTSYALSIIGTIGCILSVAGLSLTIIIYLSFRALRTKKLNQVHIHLCASLLVGYLTFLLGVERPRLYAPCLAITAVLHFAFLSAWGWMVTEFFVMYRKFIHVFADIHGTFVLRASAVVYIGSLTVTMATFLVAYITGDLAAVQPGWLMSASNDPMCWKSHYAGDRLCWLHSHSLYFGFLLPIGIMFLINFIGFFIIMHKINKKRPNLGQSAKSDPELKDHLVRVFTISSMLGVTWIFAVPLTFSDDRLVNEIFSWLFSLGNAFQGLTFFILYCVRQDHVRKFWAGYFFVFLQRNKDGTKPLDVSTATSERTASTNVSAGNKISAGNIQMQNFYPTSDSPARTGS